jgi:hypothetical protein
MGVINLSSVLGTLHSDHKQANKFHAKHQWYIFLIGIVAGGVQLGPLGTAATNRPIVPTPADYDGEIRGMIGKGN